MSGARKAKREALDALYAQIPDAGCKGLCQEFCGPVVMSSEEWQRIKERAGNVRAVSLQCPLLSPEGKCTVYEVRPMICRLWGSVESLRCPHGCKPAAYLSKEDGFEFLAGAEEISEGRRACVNQDVEVREVKTAFGKPLPFVVVKS